MKKYLIKDYTEIDEVADGQEIVPKIKIIWEDKIFQCLDKAHHNNLKIVVFEIGDCIIDWS